MAYITWADIINRYPDMADRGEADTSSGDISYAERMVETKLGPGFTVPFSSNNLTVKDLCIDQYYGKYWLGKDEDKAKIMYAVDSFCYALVTGLYNMITTNGDQVQSSGGSVVYNPTMEYSPVFNMLDPEYQTVDSSQLYDEYYD